MFVNELFEGVNPDQGVATYQQLLLAIKESRSTEIDGMVINEHQAKYLLKTFNKIVRKEGREPALEFLGDYGQIGFTLNKHAINKAKQAEYEEHKRRALGEGRHAIVGDYVIVSAPNNVEGKKGRVIEFNSRGSFIKVDCGKDGIHTMHPTDVRVLSESTINEISKKTIDDYYSAVIDQQRDREGKKFHPHGSFERLPAKRQRGIDRATQRILNKADFDSDLGEEHGEELEENLHKWFKEKWVRFGPDGKIRGDCARGSEGEGKPKCLPQKKAQALGKKKRASAAAKKRREDPNPNRKGKAKNVATKVKEQSVAEVASYPTLQNRFSAVEKKYGDVDDKTDKSWTAGKARSLMKKISRTAYNQHGKLLQKGVSETVTDVRSGMAEIYHRLAPKIEHYKDSFLAGQLYDELENYAELHGAEREFKQMMATARGRAHMEYDTNPGGFHNWFWFLPFEDNQLGEEWSEKYKKSINCSNPKGFSQKAHCDGRKKTNESLVQVPHNGKMVTGKVVRLDKGNPESPFYVVDIGEYGSIKVPAHKVKHIDEDKSESLTPQDIHDLADSKGILWDNEPSFLKLTKHLTGKEHLDDLDQNQLLTVKQFLEKFDKYEKQLNEKQDACYHKVKSRYKVWPSAYASGALVKCRKVGAKNWGTGGKKK